jgi:hypothetical protein
VTHLIEPPRLAGGAVPAAVRKRPLGVVVLAAVQFGRAALVIGQLLGLNVAPDLDWLHAAAQVPESSPGTVAYAISRGIAVAIAAASVGIGFGLLANRRSAWVGAIVISGLSLAFALGAWWDGRPIYLAMTINVIAVFYLNQREVRAVYDEPAEDAPAADPRLPDPPESDDGEVAR